MAQEEGDVSCRLLVTVSIKILLSIVCTYHVWAANHLDDRP